MLLRQLNYFITVVEANSFTEAAERCHISQSAVSQQIRALERELGVELLHRSGRKFTLTAAGEHLYRKGHPLLKELDSLLSAKMAVAETKGILDASMYPFIKHFALNEQETNRNGLLCTWTTEQAMREICLKPFEECAKAYSDGKIAIMSSYLM